MSGVLHRSEPSDADPVLDSLARCAATVAECPMSAIGVVQGDHLWFRGRQGLGLGGVPLEISFCRHTMAGAGLFEVPDTQLRADFAVHPLVVGGPRLRYYAGVPLRLEDQALGALCVGNTCPHRLHVTQRLALEELASTATQWLHARRVLARSLGYLGHEMRTPLNAMLGFSRLLLCNDASALSPREREWLQHMESGGKHLQALLDDMLQFSQLELDAAPLPLQPLPLRPVIEQVLGLLQPLAQQSAVMLHDISFDEEAWVMADMRALQQVLVNLVSNAIKYNRRHGVARIDIKQCPDAWEINVIDDGVGLSPEQMQRLFQPFSRVGNDRTVQGSGLGLCIARSLAERMKGSLSVSSAPGAGSVFTLRLPQTRL